MRDERLTEEQVKGKAGKKFRSQIGEEIHN